MSATPTGELMPGNAAARGRLWAVTAYFNPAGFARRRLNYAAFRRRLGVPLVTVELARAPQALQLGEGDADVLVQRVGEDRLWQKERLLNIALAHLPAACELVAWLDCDVVFPTADWPARVETALDAAPLVQAFGRFHELGPNADADRVHAGDVIGSGDSAVARLASGMTVEQLFAPRQGSRLQRGSTVGLAWAARRTLLDRHGFYDACVLGSGDKAIMSAALGRYEYVVSMDMNERQMAHYLAWGRPFFADVGGRIGFVDAPVYHLWHGDLQYRKHRQRHREFTAYGFDPSADIALDANGCWAWSSPKPEMHEYLRSYFASRREDG
jgi:hypothetical protein